IQSILKDYGAELPVIENLEFPLSEPAITVGRLSKGIELPESKLAIITENELFKKKKKRVRKQQNITNEERIKNYQELNICYYVVHRSHVCNLFLSISTSVVDDYFNDIMFIQYFLDDNIYLTLDLIYVVKNFVPSEVTQPLPYNFSGSLWSIVKNKMQATF